MQGFWFFWVCFFVGNVTKIQATPSSWASLRLGPHNYFRELGLNTLLTSEFASMSSPATVNVTSGRMRGHVEGAARRFGATGQDHGRQKEKDSSDCRRQRPQDREERPA